MVGRESTLEIMVLDNSFWKGKRVFLTGHTGFKGAWLSLWLKQLGADVYGYSLTAPTTPNFFTLCNVIDDLKEHTIGDIRNKVQLVEALSFARPEIVLHLAAQALVKTAYELPIETYETNVMGTVNLFEAVRKVRSVRVILNVTTDKCYENKEWIWPYREEEPMGGFDPYSSSKACSELITASYRQSFFSAKGISVASARAGNVIGGGYWAPHRLIPDFMRALEKKEPLCIRFPKAIRPWQHVLEPLSGYLTLAEKLYTAGESFAEGWNFGPSSEAACSVEKVLHTLAAAFPQAKWNCDLSPQLHEACYLKLDSHKARERLNWFCKWSIDEALHKTAEWYHAWLQNKQMREISLEQIHQYEIGLTQNCSSKAS